jgi:hypothetical protein
MVGCNRGNIRIRNKYCVLHDSWSHLDHCEMKIVLKSDQEMDAILLIIGIVLRSFRIIIKSVQQCTSYFL